MKRKIFLSDILANITGSRAASVTGFLPMVGSKYTGDLMVVGRAVNGWTEEVTPANLINPEARAKYADIVYRSVTENDAGVCPMSWVTDCWSQGKEYNTARSAFWRVIRRVVGELQIASVEGNKYTWPSHLVWSNLYKISPADGGNPSINLINLQIERCKELLQWEIQTYRPRRLLFLTGLDWVMPFLGEDWHEKSPIPDCVEVKAVGDIKHNSNVTRCVIASHPQGKKETRLVGEVVNAFQLP